jgi:hypothetical protein
MSNPMMPENPATQYCCPVVELRQYTLHPGKRDILIELFDREFVESQEALGMKVIGQFRDLDKPDRFVWLRGFADMTSRAQGLNDFYRGPVWKTHRDAANATMVDSDNVLLLRPSKPDSGFPFSANLRPLTGSERKSEGFLVATIYYLNTATGEDFADFFDRLARLELGHAGALILASFVTENSPNNFPALPVREGENVFVWFSRFQDGAAYGRSVAALSELPRWRDEISQELLRRLKRAPEMLKLSPTARSQLTA